MTLLAMSVMGSTCQKQEVSPSSHSCDLVPQLVSQHPVRLPPTLISDVNVVFEASRPCWENFTNVTTQNQINDAQSNGDLCKLEKIAFTPKAPKPSSEGQRVLVIDGAMKLSGFLRYHKRVLDFLAVDDDGSYSSTNETIELPKWMRVILKDLLGDRYAQIPTHLFPDNFTDNLTPAFKKYTDYRSNVELANPNSYKNDHGDKVFPILAEYSPEAEFMLASYGLPGEAVYCALGKNNDEEALRQIQSYFSHQSRTLTNWIENYGINFINLSANTEIESLTQDFLEICQFRPNRSTIEKVISAQYNNFLLPLAQIPGVILVQGTENRSPSHIDPTDKGQSTICGKLPNRLLVGGLGRAYSALPEEGNNRFELLSHDQRKLEQCVDVFINGGIDCNPEIANRKKGQHPVKLYKNGLFSYSPLLLDGQICVWSTSYATPVALSYLIYLKKNLQGPVSTERLLWCANNGGQGKLKDPALHRQFESYRLGFME